MNRIILIALILIFTAGVFVFANNSKTNPQNTQEISEQKVSTNKNSEASIQCSGKPMVSLTEGPYYKAGSPKRTNITSSETVGEKITLTGYVLDLNCKPIANVWLDFWQADGAGNYDNSGYNLRGYQYTDGNGKYTLETVIPGEYPGRTPHIHVKAKVPNGQIVTSQLYLPNQTQNQSDSIFDQSMIIDLNGNQANYNFVLER